MVKDLLRHIGTSAISDIILRLISCVEGTNIKQSLLEVREKKVTQTQV